MKLTGAGLTVERYALPIAKRSVVELLGARAADVLEKPIGIHLRVPVDLAHESDFRCRVAAVRIAMAG